MNDRKQTQQVRAPTGQNRGRSRNYDQHRPINPV